MADETIETRNYTGVTTKQIILEALRESTGSHLLDSGGAYGRNWQRNQTRDFEAEPDCSVSWSVYRPQGSEEGPGRLDASTTISLYHWMVAHLEFDAELQAELDQHMASHPYENYLETMETFSDGLVDQGRHDGKVSVVNTYNHTDNIHLDQVLQYTPLAMDGTSEVTHLLVSVHGGCDVRGGYGSPRAFRLRRGYDEALDGAEVRCVYLVGHGVSWYANSACWQSFELNDFEHANMPGDFVKLPAYQSEWLGLMPDVIDLTQALQRAAVQRAHLESSEYPNKVALLASLARVVEALEEEQLEACATFLLAAHPDGALLLKGKKLYLVHSAVEPTGFDELDVTSNF